MDDVITDRTEILRAFNLEGKLLQKRDGDVAIGPFDRYYSLDVLHQLEREGLVRMVGGKSVLEWRLAVEPVGEVH